MDPSWLRPFTPLEVARAVVETERVVGASEFLREVEERASEGELLCDGEPSTLGYTSDHRGIDERPT